VVFPSLDQDKRSEARADVDQFIDIIEYFGLEPIHQRQSGVTKRDIDSANLRIYSIREGYVDAVAVIVAMRPGTPRSEYCQKRLGSAAKGAEIFTSLVAEAQKERIASRLER
jgi:hypothetical protein